MRPPRLHVGLTSRALRWREAFSTRLATALAALLVLMLAHSAEATCSVSTVPFADCNGCTRDQQIKVLVNTDCTFRASRADGQQVIVPPHNGSYTTRDAMWAVYVPQKGFVGKDSMTLREYFVQEMTGKRTFVIIRRNIDVVSDAKSLVLR